MTKPDFTIRPINPAEIDKVASLLSAGYYHDKFFKWSVDCDATRHKIVADYYKIYLSSAGCVAHVAESAGKCLIGATIWLPHDTDPSTYDEIDRVVGEANAPQFRAVADRSHDSEPPMTPFYQLVGFVVLGDVQGMGVGGALLKYHLDILDGLGISTYLEASTPYFGGGVYGRFGYQQVGELMVFADSAVLYPLWRPAGGAGVVAGSPKSSKAAAERFCQNHQKRILRFGGYNWLVLDEQGGKLLLLSENVIMLREYHAVFQDVTWAESSAREYLNTAFFDGFNADEQALIVETQLDSNDNPWFGTWGGEDTTDKIFLLSAQEVARYFGDSGQLVNPQSSYFIDDEFNDIRRTNFVRGLGYTEASGCIKALGCTKTPGYTPTSEGVETSRSNDHTPSRWMLRTPGNSSNLVTTVTLEGKIAMTGDFVNRSSTTLFNVGLRPAMWIRACCPYLPDPKKG